MTRHAKLLIAATILFALGLSGCGPGRTRLASLPAELTTCAAEPLAPALPALDGLSGAERDQVQAARDALVLTYILSLRGAWGDCKAKVDGAKAWNDRVGR